VVAIAKISYYKVEFVHQIFSVMSQAQGRFVSAKERM